MDAYLKTEHLDAGYDGKAILHDVCLRVQRGRIVTLIGPNGSGKSTILKTIISQLPAIGGSVVLDGQDLRKQSRSDIARRMAILMTARMNPELMSCRDVVSSGRYPYTGRLGVLRAEDKQIVEESLRQTDALDFADKPFRAVSDGQRQRILLEAVSGKPDLQPLLWRRGIMLRRYAGRISLRKEILYADNCDLLQSDRKYQKACNTDFCGDSWRFQGLKKY